VNVRKFVSSLEKQEEFDGYSGVTIVVSDEMEYSAGSDTGRTLTLECPWGSQKMANDILAKIRGWQYQPYTASDAHLNPAAEIGDGVSVGSVYSGIYQKDVSHGPLYTANLSAPGGEKINYKYEYKSPTTRKIERQHKEVKASLAVMADQILAEVEARESDTESLTAALNIQAGGISAKVDRKGGDNASFGWSLTADGWTLTSNGGTVLKADKSGLSVTGKITATSGVIGGLTIKNGYLSTNGQTWGGTNTNGIYFGPNGIQLGKYFTVDSSGNLTAYSGKFLGTVQAGSIDYGGNAGYFDGAGLASFSVGGGQIGTDAIVNRHITSGSVYPSTCNSTINGYFADVIYANKVVTGQVQSEKLWTNRMYAAIAEISSLTVAGNNFIINGDSYMVMKKDAATYVIGRA
jgi:hypothetical protein